MEKNVLNMRSVLEKYQTNCARIKEIASLMGSENRERTEAENEEFKALNRENQLLQMKMAAAQADYAVKVENPVAEAEKALRENVASGKQTKFHFVRNLVMVSTAEPGGIIPLKVQDILKPLEEGLILHQVGLPLMSGLAGDYIWPMYEAVDATILDEGVELTDTPLTLSKLTANPDRIGIAIPVTREAINQTEGVIETIIREVMPQAITRLLNKILFSTEQVSGSTNLVGPFVGLTAEKVSAEPTFKELNLLKAKVLSTGIDGEKLCWIMTKSMQAILEATPKDAGSGIMVCENGYICGLPVYTTQYIGEGNIGLGDWRYQPMGLFGDINFIVDPYSQARKNAVDFVLNVDYGTKTLRPEAFLLAKAGGE